MTPTTEQLKDLLARAPDGPWSANYASGEINGGASGAYPVIDMNTETFDHATACVTLDDSEVATLGLIALAPTLAAEVVRLREAIRQADDILEDRGFAIEIGARRVLRAALSSTGEKG